MEQGQQTWKLDGSEVSQKDYQTLYGALLDVMLTGEKEGDTEEREERTPVLTLQFIRNTKDASDVEVKYYEYDDESMSVSVNGQEHFLVEKETVLALKKRIETGL